MSIKILWTDEVPFHLTGYVNPQNYRIWAIENPLKTQPVPLHPAEVTVCGAGFHGIIYHRDFFEETSALGPVTVTVTGRHYGCLLSNHVIPAVHQHGCVDRITFMLDGAPPYFANPVTHLRMRHFGNVKICQP